MSMYAYLDNEYAGDIASNAGWHQWAEWARGLPTMYDIIYRLASEGNVETEDFDSLDKQLVACELEDHPDWIQLITNNLTRAFSKRKNIKPSPVIFLISDGTGD